MPDKNKLLKVSEVRRMLPFSANPATVRGWMADGVIEATKLGGRWFTTPEGVQRFLEQVRAGRGPRKIMRKQLTTETKLNAVQAILVTEREAAEILQCSQTTIARQRKAGKLPFVPIGSRIIRYRRETLERIAAEREQGRRR